MEIQSSTKLSEGKCLPCEGGVESCSIAHSQQQLQVLPGWALSDDGKQISKRWKLKNFVQAMRLLELAGQIAEQEQHHPDLHLTGYRHVCIELTTHAIGGLSENDFILAAKIDAAAKEFGQ
jgi:4a-hydroxytetrahydrobiopterin dehydratase